jgi:hypothetical protein
MLEERERTYKQGLTERVDRHIGKGERVQAVAVTQVGMPPWVGASALLGGVLLIIISLLVGALPAWVGGIGGVTVLVAIVLMSTGSRRLLTRTNRSVYVFALPRSDKAEIGEPRVSVALEDLPAVGDGGSVQLGGERLWANYGSGIERDAMAEVLAPISS